MANYRFILSFSMVPDTPCAQLPFGLEGVYLVITSSGVSRPADLYFVARVLVTVSIASS